MGGSGVGVLTMPAGVRVVGGVLCVECRRGFVVCPEVAFVVRPVVVCWCNAHTLARGGQLCFALHSGTSARRDALS